MKLKTRITMEAEITESEAAILVEAAKIGVDTPDTLKRMAELILKKKFPNAGYGSYIPQEWIEELAEECGMDIPCEDLEIPEGDEAK
ncbi:hypothetical protein [Clostridium sp. AF32-12BH]|uniref:hypothetical protein n=1 Tax=Clostridium sp. AF32-12BH TaxID=2292006 RepID=UPI000E4CA729|nr:hypothetical protein [Clostridium sp. AF32-12BH]RHP47005.1 hypothetical protein DWZ40_08865 [Clostridium sp. AF32-12BH]